MAFFAECLLKLQENCFITDCPKVHPAFPLLARHFHNTHSITIMPIYKFPHLQARLLETIKDKDKCASDFLEEIPLLYADEEDKNTHTLKTQD